MYSKKSVWPRMKSWETPALTGYSSEDFPSRSICSYLLLGKEEIRPNIWPKITWDLNLWRRPACQTLLKALNISSTTAQVALDLLKVLAILSHPTVGRSAVDQEDLKPNWESDVTSSSKTLLTTERWLTRH